MRSWIATSILAASVPLGGGIHAATTLSGPLVEGGDVAFFEIAPDGSHVVYHADEEIDEVNELYSVSLDGQRRVNISGTVENYGVTSAFGRFQISRDSAWVVFRAHLTPDGGTIGLLSVPLDGSAPPTDLNGPLFGPFGSFPGDGDFEITPDSSRVLFSGAPGHSAFTTPIDGSGSKAQLDAPNIWITRNQISPDSTRLVWNDWRDHGVHAQSLDGSTPPVRLDNGPGTVTDNLFPITPDGSRIVFTAVEGPPWQGGYFSTRLDGSGPIVKISDLLLHNGGQTLVNPSDYQLTPNGQNLVYRFNAESDNKIELYVRPVDGSEAGRLLTDPNSNGSGPSNGAFSVSPDSEHVVFFSTDPASDVRELFANSLAGDSLPWKLNAPFTEGYLSRAAFTPDGGRVVYHNVVNEPLERASRYQPTVLSAHIAPIDGSIAPIELISDPAGPAVIWDSRIAPDGSFVVFSIDNDGFFYGLNEYDFPETHVLFAVPTTGGVPRPVTERLGDGRKIIDYQIAHDSRSIIYLANQEDTDVFELFSVPVVGLALPDDYNGDGVVDVADLAQWKNGFGTTGNATHMQGDADRDQDVDGTDFLTWQRQLGSVAAGEQASAAIPEPATLAMLATAALVIFFRRRAPVS